jgi:regulator of sirC expression with transglutaminase-like and TPR domain
MENSIKNKELEALVNLIDEPDFKIFERIRDKLFDYGMEAIPALEDARIAFVDHSIQQRIESIIQHIQLDYSFAELKHWRQNNESDLLKGFTIVARHRYPQLDEKEIIKKIGVLIQDVWLELNSNLTPLEKIKVINHIFFEVHGFKGNKSDIHAPQNSFINNIFETKMGNPISLSIIYMIIAQSLKIPVYGINLPQNFILSYTTGMIDDYQMVTTDDIRFYLNVFNTGAVFTRREIELFLRQINLEQDPKYFLPCNNITIIKRVLNNLIFSYENTADTERAAEIKRLQQALD